jgi:tetratricopeptide (TPR) repeat protein
MADRGKSAAFSALVLTAGIVAVVVAGTVLAVKQFGLPTAFSRLSSRPAPEMPRAPAEDLPISRGPDKTIDVARMVELRQWLAERRFEALNETLDRYQQAFMADYTREFALIDAYQSFSAPLPEDEARLESWISASPGHYQPYLAAAFYYYARGWESRGFKWRKDTTDEQINGMRLNFSKAEEKAAAALKIDPDLMPAYDLLIGIQNSNGNDPAEKETIQTALAKFPHSYVLWSRALWASEPRWGGSYAQMGRLAGAAEPNAREYPVLTALHGAAFYDLARCYKSDKSYTKALAAINKAISFGDRGYYYALRAEIYAFGMKDYDRAGADADLAVSLRPTESGNYLSRAKISFAREAYEEALSDLKTIDAIQPEDPSTLQWRQWAARNLAGRGNKRFKADLEGALKWYALSLSFDKSDPKTHYWRGVANYRLGRYTAAAAELKTCIQLDPHDFEAYRMLDYTLARDRRWDEILHFWDAFLELEPDHAAAYFERSGTHYHRHNLRQAKADLQKACDLGFQKACRQHAKVKDQL